MPVLEHTAPWDHRTVIAALHQLLVHAIRDRVSDIHFEIYETQYRIRFRHDGRLQEVATLPTELAPKITARLKVLAALDSAERRIPQDGRFTVTPDPDLPAADCRISTCPTAWGEKVVLRMAYPHQPLLTLDQLGCTPAQQQMLRHMLSQPHGMILITGPTGSGKTQTLYTALGILNTPERNICTAEDPVEIPIPGINHVPIQSKTGLHFSTVLRSLLRQDPDVIGIGEIRDQETATIAMHAAQTGHLVLSTLHTNRAAETPMRLTHWGIPLFQIATATRLIIAQRLARRLCPACKQPASLSPPPHRQWDFSAIPELPADLSMVPIGCPACHQGYQGRIGLYECMPITPAIAQAIRTGACADTLAHQAVQAGYPILYQDALDKVRAGLISLEEMQRVIGSPDHPDFSTPPLGVCGDQSPR